MNSSGARGLILVVIAVAVGAFILRAGFDDGGVVVAAESVATGGEDAVDPGDDGDGGEEPAAGDDAAGDPAADGSDEAAGDGTVEPAPDEPTTEPPTLDTQARLPADVRVIVANGARIPGIATSLTERIGARGYVTLTPDNADTTEQSAIYYREGAQADAAAVAEIIDASSVQQLQLPADGSVPGNVDLRDADIFILIGTSPSALLPEG